MILYLDTAALVPLLAIEPASENCRRLWDAADRVAVARVGFVETSAALAQARRLGRLTPPAHRDSVTALEELWELISVVELDDRLMRRSAQIAELHALRGYDAVHAAAAESLASDHVVAASGDRALLRAWIDLGVSTSDTNPR